MPADSEKGICRSRLGAVEFANRVAGGIGSFAGRILHCAHNLIDNARRPNRHRPQFGRQFLSLSLENLVRPAIRCLLPHRSVLSAAASSSSYSAAYRVAGDPERYTCHDAESKGIQTWRFMCFSPVTVGCRRNIPRLRRVRCFVLQTRPRMAPITPASGGCESSRLPSCILSLAQPEEP